MAKRGRGKGWRAGETKITPTRQKEICDALSIGVPLEYAAALAGVEITTVNRARKNSASLCAAIKEAEGKLIQGLTSIILVAAKDGQWTAGAWLLERRWPHLFSKIEKTELSGPGGTPLPPSQDQYIIAVRHALGFTDEVIEKQLPAMQSQRPRRKQLVQKIIDVPVNKEPERIVPQLTLEIIKPEDPKQDG